MFDSLLIANRGEIACRIIRTARRFAIRTVAVFSEADAGSLHVASADEAILIGPAPATRSYLDISAILTAAERTGAQAVHPGYGFLAENAEFAEACAATGLVFVGPPPEAIRAMGSKSAAKNLMAKAGVPLIPGYHGEDQDPDVLAAEASRIGYPVLIKPSRGGGGKGMRVVECAERFVEALAGARREALSSFGDEHVLIEKYLARPRHVEVQVFADQHGNVVHLFERDCSLQRRHQKVIEEAPAAGLDAKRRSEMGETAVLAAKAIGYVGAGTIEFLVEESGFYFIEMNTRLQVEHPVTEMVTGQDLVEWQLRVAAGEVLPLDQADLATAGHALEGRIYAEDPAKDFLPAAGRLVHLRLPDEGKHVRVDTGVRSGDRVSSHYDPMIAKLVVWDRDRPAALRRLRAALAETEIAGLANNVPFLLSVAAHPGYVAGRIDIGFLDRHRAELLGDQEPPPDDALALACIAELLHRKAQAEEQARRSGDPYSPWHLTTGWRLNVETHNVLRFLDGSREHAITVHYRRDGYRLDLPAGSAHVRGELSADGRLWAEVANRRLSATIVRQGRELTIFCGGASYVLSLHDPLAIGAVEEAGGGRLTAPMPGRVAQVHVRSGASVARGTALLVLEAMKMEHTITAPVAGTVVEVHFGAGDLVEEGAELVTLAMAEE